MSTSSSPWEDAMDAAVNRHSSSGDAAERKRRREVAEKLYPLTEELLELYSGNNIFNIAQDNSEIDDALFPENRELGGKVLGGPSIDYDPEDNSLFNLPLPVETEDTTPSDTKEVDEEESRETWISDTDFDDDFNPDIRLRALIRTIKESFAVDDYDEEAYDRALKVLRECLHYYVNPKKNELAKKVNATLEEIFKSRGLSFAYEHEDDEQEDDETHSLSGPRDVLVNYTKFSEGEYKKHRAFLERLKQVALEVGAHEFAMLVEGVLNEINNYYENGQAKDRFEENIFVKRGYEIDPKGVFVERLENGKNSLISGVYYSYVRDPQRSTGFEYKAGQSPNIPDGYDEKYDHLIKSMLEAVYNQLIQKVEEVGDASGLIYRDDILRLTDQFLEWLKSLLDVLAPKEILAFLERKGVQDPSQITDEIVEDAIWWSGFNWAVGDPIGNEINHYIKAIEKIFQKGKREAE